MVDLNFEMSQILFEKLECFPMIKCNNTYEVIHTLWYAAPVSDKTVDSREFVTQVDHNCTSAWKVNPLSGKAPEWTYLPKWLVWHIRSYHRLFYPRMSKRERSKTDDVEIRRIESDFRYFRNSVVKTGRFPQREQAHEFRRVTVNFNISSWNPKLSYSG